MQYRKTFNKRCAISTTQFDQENSALLNLLNIWKDAFSEGIERKRNDVQRVQHEAFTNEFQKESKKKCSIRWSITTSANSAVTRIKTLQSKSSAQPLQH